MTLSRTDEKLPHKIVHMFFIDTECHHLPCCGAFQHMDAKEGGTTSEFYPEINVVASVLIGPVFISMWWHLLLQENEVMCTFIKEKDFREVSV